MAAPEFTPDNDTGRMVNAPGFARLRPLNGWRADGTPEVLTSAGSVPVFGPCEVVEAKDAPDYPVRERQAAMAAEARAAAQAAERSAVRAVILDELHAVFSAPEVVGGLTHREQTVRSVTLEQLGREGVCRPVGKRPVNRAWLLTAKHGGFVPAAPGTHVLVAGADADRIPDGIHVLVGMLAGAPAVIDRWTRPITVTVVRSGRWKLRGAEDARRWVELARAEVDRQAAPDTEDVRVRMLNRLIEEHAIVPTSDGERVLLETLTAEGYARTVENSYVLAVEVPGDGY